MVSNAAIVQALTGQRIGEISSWADWLAENYPEAALRTLIAERQRAGQPWPFPVPVAERGVGAAQWAAVMREVLAELEIATVAVAEPAPARPFSSDELRLLAEVPPHHVG